MAMTTKSATKAPAQPQIGAETLEKVLIQGDLKALTAAERVSYYNGLCKTLKLNPLGRPFDYLILNGKLQLYAKRECTDQLRRIHNVNLTIKARETMGDCFIVTATATLPDGRQDESIGVVAIDGLKNEAKANALMKTETKAKRRATLSLCGLAFLDESELDGVRGGTHATVDTQTGELMSPDADPQPVINSAPALSWAQKIKRARPRNPWVSCGLRAGID